MLLDGLLQLIDLLEELVADFLPGWQVGELLLVYLLLHEEAEDKMLVHFRVLMEGGLGETALGLDEDLPEPGHLLEAGLIDVGGPVEGLFDTQFGGLVLAFDHLVDHLELVIELFVDQFGLILQHLLVLLHRGIDIPDACQLLLEYPQVVLIVSRHIGDGILAGDNAVILVHRAAVYAVYAQQLELVLAVERDEVVVDQALLGQLVLEGQPVEVQAGLEVLLTRLQRVDVIRVVLLQQHRSLGRGTLLAHARVGVRRVRQRLTFLAARHTIQICYGNNYNNKLPIIPFRAASIRVGRMSSMVGISKYKLLIKVIKQMSARIEEVFQFCAFYSTTKAMAELSIVPISELESAKKQPKTSTVKTCKKKFEHAGSAKGKHSSNIPTVSKKLDFDDFDNQPPRDKSQEKYGLSYYLNHIAGNPATKSTATEYNTNQYRKPKEPLFNERTFNDNKNYETFGNSSNQANGGGPVEYLNFAEKMRRSQINSGKGNLTERPWQPNTGREMEVYPNEWQRHTYSRSGHLQEESPINKSKLMSSIQNYQQQRSKLSNYPFESQIYESPSQRETNLMYSPVCRDSQIGSSSFYENLNLSPDRELSRSKSRNKKKTAERPFYVASRLSRQEKDKGTSHVTSTFELKKVESFEEQAEPTENGNVKKVPADDHSKRETDLTVKQSYPSNRSKVVSKIKNGQIEMDDACEEYLRLAIENQKSNLIHVKRSFKN